MSETASHFNKFDAAAAGEILGVEPQPRRDPAHGEGYEFPLGQAEVVVYPERAVVEVKTDRGRHELLAMSSYALRDGAVVFEQAGTEGTDDRPTMRLRMQANGVPSYYPVVRARLTSEAPPPGETVRSVASDASGPATRPDGGTSAPQEGQEVPQEQLRGFITKYLWHEVRDGEFHGGFLLGVDADGRGKKDWHRVSVFGQTAQQLGEDISEGRIKKGDTVDVTGTTVVTREPTARGGRRRDEQFHASSYVRVAKPTPRRRR